MHTEADLQNAVRLRASREGGRLWRNNCGAAYDPRGNFIRYGLANDSAQLNRIIKSGDLVGIQPVLITHEHIGKIIGEFRSFEIKKPGWKFSPRNKRDVAQQAWIDLILSLGGYAKFITDISEY